MLISTAVAAANLLKVGEFEERLDALEDALEDALGQHHADDDATFPSEEHR